MKITDIKIDGFGVWRDLSLRGLSPELNILAGANEAGKSTILAALRMAFEQSHKPTHREVAALRPSGGGAPQVEVDFAIGDDVWRGGAVPQCGR